ncbi:MAG TPA: hypothetical protein DCS23_00195 [Candidatus Yonathbacteria bacterium]|nr:hypothetical protein [Candidatus Yonathbacteria bacterium]
MSKSDDYIIITESHDMDKWPIDSDMEVHDEKDDASLRVLEGQGISIIAGEHNNPHETSSEPEPREQFSRELMDEGGIEIFSEVERDEEESFL